jgi:hypothetical protein
MKTIPHGASDEATERSSRMNFMRITPETSTLLREFWKIAEPKLPDILEAFYRHVTSEPKLAAMLGKDIPRLKTAQGTHWARLFDGAFDADYMRGVRTIGHIHNKIGLEPRWYIGGYNMVLSRRGGQPDPGDRRPDQPPRRSTPRSRRRAPARPARASRWSPPR